METSGDSKLSKSSYTHTSVQMGMQLDFGNNFAKLQQGILDLHLYKLYHKVSIYAFLKNKTTSVANVSPEYQSLQRVIVHAYKKAV